MTPEHEALRLDVGNWLERSMFCVDWYSEEMPPPSVWEAFIDAVHRDERRKWHDGDLSREDCDYWLREEAGYPQGEPTPKGH